MIFLSDEQFILFACFQPIDTVLSLLSLAVLDYIDVYLIHDSNYCNSPRKKLLLDSKSSYRTRSLLDAFRI